MAKFEAVSGDNRQWGPAVAVCSRSPVDGTTEVVKDMAYYQSISPLRQLDGAYGSISLEPLIAYVERCGAVGWSEKTGHDALIRWMAIMGTEALTASDSTGTGSESTISRSARRRRARQGKKAEADCARDVKAAEPGYAYVRLFRQDRALAIAGIMGTNPTLTAVLTRQAADFAPGVLAGKEGFIQRVDKWKWVFDEPGHGAVAVAHVAIALNQLLAGTVSGSVMKNLCKASVTGVEVLANDRLVDLAYPLSVVREAQQSGLCYLKSFPCEMRPNVYARLGSFPTVGQVVQEKHCDLGTQVISADVDLWHVVDEGDTTLQQLSQGKEMAFQRVGADVRCGELGFGHLVSGRCKVCRDRDLVFRPTALECCGLYKSCLAEEQAVVSHGAEPMTVVVRGDMVGKLGSEWMEPSRPVCGVHGYRLDQGKLNVQATVARIVVPPGHVAEIAGTGVEIEAIHHPVHLIGLDSLAVTVRTDRGDKALCVALWVGDWEDKVRWMHRDVGEEPANTFSRFWTRVGGPVAVSTSLPYGFDGGDGLGPDIGPLELVEHGEVSGVVQDRLVAGVHPGALDGMAFHVVDGNASLVLMASAAPLVGAEPHALVRLSAGSCVTVARRVSRIKVLSVTAGAKGFKYLADDAYDLDDGGPSDEEGFVGEY